MPSHSINKLNFSITQIKETRSSSLGLGLAVDSDKSQSLTNEEQLLCRAIDLREGLRQGFIDHLKEMLGKEVDGTMSFNAEGLKRVHLGEFPR